MKSIYWLRSDLRFHDNEALFLAAHKSTELAFVYTHKPTGPYRAQFLHESLLDLDQRLREKGHALQVTDLSIIELVKENPEIEAVFYTREYAFNERQEEAALARLPVKTIGVDQGALLKESELPFPANSMPFVFSDFRRKIEGQTYQFKTAPLPRQWPTSLILADTRTLEPNSSKIPSDFQGGETAGLKRLTHYLWESRAVATYKETRNGMIAFDDSTKFSPWLNLGSLSPRMVMSELKRFEREVTENHSTYWVFFELLWRDYFKYFSLKYGKRIFHPEGVARGSSPNHNDEALFRQWCEGKTREPFVNANMQELNRTGWMSNRGRQNVASYLIHDLGVNWTWGAAYFEEKLLDYDPDLNWGNWLYLSGRGSDPRARKFNIQKQMHDYDPSGAYVMKWS